jgi:conjugal transfer mating pair stabilization protein TraN
MQKIMNNTINQQDALKSNAYNYLKNFSPKNHFDHYSDSPTETKYYSGVTQKGSGQLDQDAVVAKGNSYAGKTISQSIHSHPSFVINSSDSSITHSQVITDNAEEIVRGVTNRYVNCQSEQVCKTGYVKNVCEESPQEVFQSCRKTLNIDVIPHETDTHFPLKVHVSTRDHDYSGVVVNVVNGNISFVGPRDTTFKMDGRLPNGLDCHTLQGSITNFNTNNRNTKLDSIIYPSCSGMDLNFHLSGRGTINLDMQIDIVSKVITYEVKDRWVEDCDGLLQEPSCTFKSKVCTQPKETRIFQGMQVTRDCWQERYDYICHAGSGSGDCTTLQAQGCEQIDSTCKNQKNDQCLLYQQTYQCPIKSCSPSSNINCGDGSNYCLDGNCIDHQYQPSKDFAKGVSSLSAVADASKQFDPSTMSIFSGHPVECSEKPVGFSNCCTETGWGKDVGLANCSMQEKKLHEDRDKGVSIKIGRYCSGSDPFPCLEHSQVFCVFNSKLARIVQDQGRKGQLNIGFGSGKNPNCSGLTPAQLQSIDLSRIDFQDFYADIHAKAPDINQIQQMLSNHIKEFQEAGQVNG